MDSLVDDGARIRVLDRKDEKEARENLSQSLRKIEYLEGNITDHESVRVGVKSVDYVFHLAANASVPNSVNHPHEDFLTNALGSLTLYEEILKVRPATKIVFASSAAIYGESQHALVSEGHPQSPISPYGTSKLTAERYGFLYHALYGLRFVSARIFNTYGPRQPRYIMFDFLKKISRDPTKLQILGNGQQIRDYCYVQDTIKALKLLASTKGTSGQAYNVASGYTANATGLAKLMIQLLGLEDVSLEYTGASWKGDVQRWVADTTKLKRLGFRAEYNLETGLKELIKWFRSQEKS